MRPRHHYPYDSARVEKDNITPAERENLFRRVFFLVIRFL